MLDALLPMKRRAQLWELYLQHYHAVLDDAQDDFHQVFGKAFVKAYEEQIDRLAKNRRDKRPPAR
jgi:FHA domain-containing protein